GDVVAVDQPLLEVQADKAALDVPSPVAGKVKALLVEVGDQINVGQVYCTIETVNSGHATNGDSAVKTASAPVAPTKTAAHATESVGKSQSTVNIASLPIRAITSHAKYAPGTIVPAGPATRHLARELGVDLSMVTGTGRNGRIIEEDIKSYVRDLAAGGAPAPGHTNGVLVSPPLPNFEQFGAVERQQLSRVRKLTARQMALAWNLIPHVTQHDLADITALEAFRKSREGKGPKLTVTAFALKASAIALKQFPTFNASLDLTSNQLILKRYYHIGVAVDTEGGLLVPVLRDVDKKSVNELAQELNDAAEKARHGKADMSGGTFTITNLGGIGGTAFTPIVNWPEVAILGLSRSRPEPTIRDGQLTSRLMLPLSLSYDHRVIDGAAAGRFTRRIAELLENPLLMAL
ncbi:MAG: 2-oxo acid dehydrogenase subunit E2, partial [Candidatus Acidiferrum sp.]